MNADATTAIVTVIANSWNRRPMMPDILCVVVNTTTAPDGITPELGLCSIVELV